MTEYPPTEGIMAERREPEMKTGEETDRPEKQPGVVKK